MQLEFLYSLVVLWSKNYLNFSKSLGVEKKIKFTDYNQEEAPKIYNSADIYFILFINLIAQIV